MSHRAAAAFHLMMDAVEREVVQATETEGGQFFVDMPYSYEAPPVVDEERAAILVGNGFQHLDDGRWLHVRSGKILSRRAVEGTEVKMLRLLIALALLA